MKILFFGRFNPDYSRNAMLLAGLRLQGAEVEECRIVHRSLFWPIIAAWNLIKRRGSFDVVLVAFPGQEVMPIVWLCTRKPIIFDGFTYYKP